MAELAADVAAIARLIARAGLVEAFGHVSARTATGFALTSTRPLGHQQAPDVLELDADGRVLRGEHCPLEAPLHAAVYRRRADVGAICRTHSPSVAIWACRHDLPPLHHGLGGLAGRLARHNDPQLVADPAAGEAAGGALGDADCVLLAANGAACTAPDLPQAAVRAWYLEERARLALSLLAEPPLAGEVLTRRAGHYDNESVRAWHWLHAQFGDAAAQGEPNPSTEPPKERP